MRRPPRSTRTDTLLPYTALFRSHGIQRPGVAGVTVVVLTYHLPDGLNALLASIAAQDRGDLGLEVIICNNASSRRLGGMRHRRRLKRLIDLKVVDSSYNWACSVRYAFATMATYRSEERRVGNECYSACKSRG